MEGTKRIKRIMLCLLIASVLVGAGYGISLAVKSSETPLKGTQAAAVAMVPANFSDLASKVSSSVINIQTTKTVKSVGQDFREHSGGPFDDFFGRFFGNNPPEDFQEKGLGSGFVISHDGYILTNNHVVEGASHIKVKIADGKEFDAKVVGRDPKTDIAVIKIEGASDLKPLMLGNSDELKVGNWVIAVGNPFGLDQTVTAGIVSGKARVIGSGPYDNYIQTDASINPGNSGGPLINMNGEVVGINTAIMASGHGIGFAIPINMAKDIIPQLEEKGHVTRGWLGVSIQEVTPSLAESFGLKEKKGALVTEVIGSGPAEKAGIQRGDVLLQFDGKDISGSRNLPQMVASTPIGKTVLVKLLRDQQLLTREVRVGEMESKGDVANVPTQKPLGVAVRNVTPETAGKVGVKSETGVLVIGVEPGSPAADAGVQRGDVIVEVNRKAVKDVEEFSRSIIKAEEHESILLLIQRGQNTLYAAVTPK